MRRRVRALTLASALAVTFAACSPEGSPSDRSFERPSLEEVPQVVADQALPVDQYLLPFDDRIRLQQGTATLVERCLVDRGFEVAIYGDYLRPPGVVPFGGLVGTMSREHAASRGYQAGPLDPFKLGIGMYQRTLDNLTIDPQLDPGVRNDPVFRSALDGPLPESGNLPDGVGTPAVQSGSDAYDKGCWELVDEEVGAPLLDTREAEGDAFDLAAEHPRVVDAMADWVTCMTACGYDYQSVIGGFQEFAYTAATPRQTRVAVDDVECTSSSGWADLFYAALVDYQEQAIEHDPELFEASLTAQQDRLASVERLLGAG